MADTIITIKTDDTRPYVSATITDQDGAVVDLTGATVVFNMVTDDTARTAKVTNGSVTLTDATKGVCEYRWSAGDTDTAGNYLAEFQVTQSDATIFTVPSDNSLKIKIKSDYN